MGSTLLGSNAAGWVEIDPEAPADGAHSEKIMTQSTSLQGVTTTNLRAVKRRWQWDVNYIDSWLSTQIFGLYETPGPFYLFDPTSPSTTPLDRRMMRGWIDSTSVIGVPTIDLRLALVATRTYSWEPLTGPSVARLARIPAAAVTVFGVTAKATTTSTGLTLGLSWYDAEGVAVAPAASIAVSLTTVEARYALTATAPASAVYMQATLLAAAAGVTVTDPVTGSRDHGPAWCVVSFDDLAETHHTEFLHSFKLTLKEV